MRVRRSIPLALTLGLLAMMSLAPFSQQPGITPSSLASHQTARTNFAQFPISFEINQGQISSRVRFLAHGPGYSLFLTPTEALLALNTSRHILSDTREPLSPATNDPALLAATGPSVLVGMQFVNATLQPEVTGEQPLPGIVNYFLGNDPAQWHTNIPTYAQVRYHNIYPGIDLIYHGNQGHLEYDFIVAPGSDPSQIRLNFTGTSHLSLDAYGGLLLHLADGDFSEGAPHAYQLINGVRQQIGSRYILQGTSEVSFALGTYDTSQPLVIDPLMFFSTYLGGMDNDYSTNLAVDSLGNAYITGATSSSNFPIQNGLQPALDGPADAFVTKVNAAGTALVYSTYLGGSGADSGAGIAVDSAGNVYVTGVTFSTDFPTQNPLQATSGGGADDAFAVKLSPTGTGLIYSTYLGGNGADWGNGIAVDSTGSAYITGGTGSTSFPTANPLQSANAGNANAFIAKLNPTGTGLVYATYLGGSNYDYASGIAVDGTGNAYITGVTHSSNFPTANPLQSVNGGAANAFITKVNPTGTGLVYSTYLGGNSVSGGSGIALDGAGNAYITGSTSSTNFPTRNALQSTNAGGIDAFVAKLNAAGSSLIYSTYLGGSNTDIADSIAVDGTGNAYITGSTSSTNFPTRNALQPAKAGSTDAFITSLDAAGSAFLYSSYLGGGGNDGGTGIAIDSMGNIYVSGATASSNLPTSNLIQGYGGMEDGFLVKMSLLNPPQFQISPGSVALTTTPGNSPGAQMVLLSNTGGMTLNWVSNSLPSWVSVSPTSGTLAPGASQTLTLTFSTPSTTPQSYSTFLVLTDSNAANSPFSLPITVVSATVSKTWYFAEGYTGGSFTEFLTLANPNTIQANVQVTYLLGSGAPIVHTYLIAPTSRYTINVNGEVGYNQNVSMAVTADQPIIAERPMYFTYTGLSGLNIPGGSDVLGATQLNTAFDFGYLDTNSGHDTYLTILNQNSSTLNVTIQYFAAGGGGPSTRTHAVPPNSRGTVHVNAESLPPDKYSALVTLDQPGLVERPMYLKDSTTGYTGSADVVGVPVPQQNWYFAEGYTASTFSERYILSNPSTTVTAHATITFFRSDGTTATTTATLAPGAQGIVNANSILGLNVNNSATVQADAPILAERFISFQYTGAVGGSGSSSIPGATDVLGAGAATNLFYFAEGYTGNQFAEYLTIENPDPTQAAYVTVTFLPANGSAPLVKVYMIAPSSRFTLFTNGVLGNQSFSMVVESNIGIVAERPMYFNFPGHQTGGSDVIGYEP